MVELTPASIANTLANISKEIENKADEIAELDRDSTAMRVLLKKAYAEKFLTTEASNEVRRYTAELYTSDMLYKVEIQEALLRSARESMKVLRDRLEVGRSLGAIMRMEWSGRE